MRILKVTQVYYPFLEKGGPAVKVPAIARALAQRGHSVKVLTADWGVRARWAQPETLGRVREGWRADQQGVETIYLNVWPLHPRLAFPPGLGGYCRRSLGNSQLAHIYGLYDLLGPAVASFCRRRNIPYVLEPMGMFRPIVRSLRWKRLYHLLLGSRLVGGAARVIATSEQERHELVEDGVPAAKVAVRRNGIELPEKLPRRGAFRQQWGIAPGTQVVLFLGRLVAKKSPELLLEIFARYLPGGEPCTLVLAGPEEGDGYREKLESLTTRLGLDGRVLFPGPLFDEAKWAAYQDADVFVLPSQHENFGNAAAEAVACRTPVLVTDRCGIAPLVARRAGLVVPYDLDALGAGLKQLLRDAALRERLRDGCAEVAQALSWEEPLALMEDLYSKLSAGVGRN